MNKIQKYPIVKNIIIFIYEFLQLFLTCLILLHFFKLFLKSNRFDFHVFIFYQFLFDSLKKNKLSFCDDITILFKGTGGVISSNHSF